MSANAGSEHVAVVDLGSNSVRLVVYDGLRRAPVERFNEKSLCRLGASLDADGNLGRDAMECTLRALARFRAVAASLRVGRIELLATEATRRAGNGEAFRARLQEASGLEVRVLGGDDEARLAATGVLAGFHRPDGLVGDLGGGSLEIAEVRPTGVGEGRVSVPLGALRIAARLDEESPKAVRLHVDEALAEALPEVVPGATFYVVGGGWRTLAKVHVANARPPVPIVHGLALDPPIVRDLARKLADLRGDEPRSVRGVPKRRVPTAPAASLVLDRTIRHLRPGRVVFSEFGVREGWLYEALPEAERELDPLLAGCRQLAAETARVPAFGAALVRWTDMLFVGESAPVKRLRIAATELSDIAWREKDDVQARYAWARVMSHPFAGLSHPGRVFLAATVYARYRGKSADFDALELLDDEQRSRAHVLGTAMLLGHRFSGSVPEILDRARLRVDADSVTLEVDASTPVPGRGAVRKRLRRLAKALGREGAVLATERSRPRP